MQSIQDNLTNSKEVQPMEPNKAYVGFIPTPKFVHIGKARIQLDDIRYYLLTSSNELRIYLYSMKDSDYLIINEPNNTAIVEKLDSMLAVVKL